MFSFFLNPGLQVANVDPKSLCDFNPCEEAGCLHDPDAKCITDFECNPMFFNVKGDMLPKCKGKLYSTDTLMTGKKSGLADYQSNTRSLELPVSNSPLLLQLKLDSHL